MTSTSIPPILAIRVDAQERSGLGHFMRCIALAQAWQNLGGLVTILTNKDLQEALRHRLQRERIELEFLNAKPGSAADAREFITRADQLAAKAIVIDGYHFKQDYQRAISTFRGTSLTIDDLGALPFYGTTWILNQGFNAVSSMFETCAPNSGLLLGRKYALLRDEFRLHPDRNRPRNGKVKRVLVTMGGTDPGNLSRKVAAVLARLSGKGLKFRILAGLSDCQGEEIVCLLRNDARFDVLPLVDDMASHYAWADLAIAAGGSSNWEMCLFGLPRVLLVTADNQIDNVNGLVSAGAALRAEVAQLDDPACLKEQLQDLFNDPKGLKEMGVRARQLVDDNGPRLVAARLRNLQPFPEGQSKPILRPAGIADWRMLFNWRNDAIARKYSQNHDKVDLETHWNWFSAGLKDRSRQIFIAECEGLPVGTVRLDRTAETAVISWTVAPEARGRGLGSDMVGAALSKTSGRIVAVIHCENHASTRIAEKAGFVFESRDREWLHFQRFPVINQKVEVVG